MIVPPEGEPDILSSLRIAKNEKSDKICGGLTIEPRASTDGPGEIVFTLPITNHTDNLWRGTVSLQLGDTRIPVDVGEVGPGQTRSDSVSFSLEEGSHEVNGSLLIGP